MQFCVEQGHCHAGCKARPSHQASRVGLLSHTVTMYIVYTHVVGREGLLTLNLYVHVHVHVCVHRTTCTRTMYAHVHVYEFVKEDMLMGHTVCRFVIRTFGAYMYIHVIQYVNSCMPASTIP